MSSKAKSAKEEAPLSPTKKGKKGTKGNSPKKDPKSPAKVKSVKKSAETPVKTSSKKKAAETPQTKPKEKRSGPYEARWKKAMCVARGPYFFDGVLSVPLFASMASGRCLVASTPSGRHAIAASSAHPLIRPRRHAHTTQEHLPEVPARFRTRRHRLIWYIDSRYDAHDD